MLHKISNLETKSSVRNCSQNEKIEDIIAALDYLRNEAKRSGNEDIYNLIDSTFSICLHTFCIIRRYELQERMSGLENID